MSDNVVVTAIWVAADKRHWHCSAMALIAIIIVSAAARIAVTTTLSLT